MILHEELCDLESLRDLYPELSRYLRGATALVSANGEQRLHYIKDTTRFPLVDVEVVGSSSATQARNFFTYSVYKDAEWQLRQEADEESLREVLARGSAVRRAKAAADRDEIERQRVLSLEVEKAKRQWRLQAALEGPSEWRNWPILLRDLDAMKAELKRPSDVEFIESVKFRPYRLTSPQTGWLNDILRRVVTSKRR